MPEHPTNEDEMKLEMMKLLDKLKVSEATLDTLLEYFNYVQIHNRFLKKGLEIYYSEEDLIVDDTGLTAFIKKYQNIMSKALRREYGNSV